MTKTMTTTLLAALLLIPSCLNPGEVANKDKVIAGMSKTILKSFPKVSHLSVEEFQKDPKFLLIDVRSQRERDISMISGAITKSQFELQRETYKDRIPVAYCTIGQRSSQYIQDLAKKEKIHGFSLKEGILGWVNRSLPLVDPKGQPTFKVHVMSEAWNFTQEPYKGVWDE
ncbi:MAG: rhodanese-like domain-containing protein [Bdellovibrionota bacterium]|nr:rhodanese-like domain-containing protein [Bdellovibrionota bacterium]